MAKQSVANCGGCCCHEMGAAIIVTRSSSVLRPGEGLEKKNNEDFVREARSEMGQ